MRWHAATHSRPRWFIALFVLALIASVAFSGIAIRADDPTAPPNNTVNGLGAPPPTAVPTATTTPTATIAPAATTAPTMVATTPAVTPASTASGTPSAASPATTSGPPVASSTSGNAIDYEEAPNDGGGKNIVKVQNKTDNRLRVRAKIQLNHIPGDNVQPVNYAQAIGSCTDCQTFAVALQIDLRNPAASVVAPQNAAVAVNIKCTRCTTVADAYQFVVPVDDPTQTPDNVKDLINQMQQELKAIADTSDITAAVAEARINTVIGQFTDLAQRLYQQHDQKSDDDTPGATVPPDAIVLTPTGAPTP